MEAKWCHRTFQLMYEFQIRFVHVMVRVPRGVGSIPSSPMAFDMVSCQEIILHYDRKHNTTRGDDRGLRVDPNIDD